MILMGINGLFRPTIHPVTSPAKSKRTHRPFHVFFPKDAPKRVRFTPELCRNASSGSVETLSLRFKTVKQLMAELEEPAEDDPTRPDDPTTSQKHLFFPSGVRNSGEHPPTSRTYSD